MIQYNILLNNVVTLYVHGRESMLFDTLVYVGINWRPPSQSELIPIIFNTKLIYFDLDSSILFIILLH